MPSLERSCRRREQGVGVSVEEHHVAGGRVFPRDSTESGRALGADVVGKKWELGGLKVMGIV